MGIAVVLSLCQPKTAAQALPTTPSITFNNFSAIYHLNRDAQNHSLLTTEEVILADFPTNGSFYGITRAIPKHYQGRNVEVKVLSVTDAAGTPLPYKAASDKNDNLVVTTGDPSIMLFGSQTIRLNYQTRDVININAKNNEFLLDINGRGWSQPFNQVSATIFIPKSFSANLNSKPSCYIGYLNSTTYDCTIKSQESPQQTIITSKANSQLAAHHSLVVKTDFELATFSAKSSSKNKLLFGVMGGVAILALAVFGYRRSVNIA
ncbi:DUF2207 domain-containing protein [Candidatus Saccharibacteria bacterium]|nr:DUF2207 domain-containing protein [Candidatus Saccharibacteria bacterium]